MKIAIISSAFLPAVDGVSVTVLNRLRKLSQYGHQVLLLCPDYSPLAAIYPNWQDYTGTILPGVSVVSLPSMAAIGLDFERDPRQESYPIVLQELSKFRPDIIHVDEPERLATRFLRRPGLDYAKRDRIPCVSFFHTNYIEYFEDYFPLPAVVSFGVQSGLKFFFSWVYNAYDLTLVSSNITYQKVTRMGIKNAWNDNLLGFNAEKFNAGFREESFFDKRYGIPNIAHKVKLVFLGRLTPDKGWHFTLGSIPKLKQKTNPDNLAIIVAGEGPMRDEIADGLSKLSAHVHLLGRISPDEVPALFANSDIYVTASEKETRGLTVLEASAAGLPVIAPRAGGVIDSIKDNWNGFLYEPQNQDDFIQKLKLLVDDCSLRKEMGSIGKEGVSDYSWDKTVKKLLQIWEEQIAKKLIVE